MVTVLCRAFTATIWKRWSSSLKLTTRYADLYMTILWWLLSILWWPSAHFSEGQLLSPLDLWRWFTSVSADSFDGVVWQGKYKVYNLCSERLYDASLLEGKVCCILQIVWAQLNHNCLFCHTLVEHFCCHLHATQHCFLQLIVWKQQM
jgi:hypothetical protein